MIISIIPARGGSKRLPRKNILPLCGKPMIAYTIEASRSSRLVDRTIVTTDDPEIRKVALEYGAEVIERPPELATDTATSADVVRHAVMEVEKEGERADIVVLLQPTSPIRKEGRIDEAIGIFRESGADTVLSVTRRHIGAQWILERKGRWLNFLSENDLSVTRTQDEKETFEINGSIYVYSREVAASHGRYMIGKKIAPLVLTRAESVDIDTNEDLEIAECLLRSG